MKNKKQIRIYHKDWKWFMKLKTEYNFSSAAELFKRLRKYSTKYMRSTRANLRE